MLPAARALGIGFVAYSPLGRGFLTGAMRSPDDFAPDDRRRLFPRFQGDNFGKNLELVDAIARLAGRRGVKASQLALAWVLSRGEDVVPVFGTKRRAYLDENLERAGSAAVRERAGRAGAHRPTGRRSGRAIPGHEPGESLRRAPPRRRASIRRACGLRGVGRLPAVVLTAALATTAPARADDTTAALALLRALPAGELILFDPPAAIARPGCCCWPG